jgi:hypothetical protein
MAEKVYQKMEKRISENLKSGEYFAEGMPRGKAERIVNRIVLSTFHRPFSDILHRRKKYVTLQDVANRLLEEKLVDDKEEGLKAAEEFSKFVFGGEPGNRVYSGDNGKAFKELMDVGGKKVYVLKKDIPSSENYAVL